MEEYKKKKSKQRMDIEKSVILMDSNEASTAINVFFFSDWLLKLYYLNNRITRYVGYTCIGLIM